MWWLEPWEFQDLCERVYEHGYTGDEARAAASVFMSYTDLKPLANMALNVLTCCTSSKIRSVIRCRAVLPKSHLVASVLIGKTS